MDPLLVVLIAVLFLVLSIFITLFVIIYKEKQLKFRKTTEVMKMNFQQELLKSQLEIQEANFLNISQEIHDNIGQALSFIKLNINTIDIAEQDAAREKLAESKNLLTKVIQDLRDLSRTLNPDFIRDIGLLQAIEQQVSFLKKSGLFTIDLVVTGEVKKYSLQQELVVYRIVQELLNNIVKHAAATAITIQLNYQPGQLQILVTDNGRGFDITAQPGENGNGLGLRNMHNRINMINGVININSSHGNGTTVEILLPGNPETAIAL